MFSRASSSGTQQELARTAGRNSASDLRHGGILHGLDRQAPTHAALKPAGRCAIEREPPSAPPASIPPRPKRSASNARSNGESTSHTPTNSHPTTPRCCSASTSSRFGGPTGTHSPDPWPRRGWPATRRHRVLPLGRASTVRDWTPCSLPFHAFKGRVVQYVGRIPRPIQGKHTVEVHAYVDIAIPVLARMYDKRLTSFATFGVTTTNPGSADAQPRRQHSCRTPTDPTHAFSHTYPNQSRVRVRPSAVDIGSDAIFQEFSVARPP